MKSISVEQISQAGSQILKLHQSQNLVVTNVLPPDKATANSLVFISTEQHFTAATLANCRALIILESLFTKISGQIPPNCAVWSTKNIQASMVAILGLFNRNREHITAGVHPSAVVHPSAKISASAYIGPNTVIEAHATIGDNCIIYPQVYIGAYCEIGHRCTIFPHTTIGADGFGFYTDANFQHHKVPQIGKVVIEDDCEIGSHCAIDRATLTETRIKRGSKFDNFCHIAHNVQIGENALVAAGFIVAGSTIIGKNLMTSGGVHALGHLKIADNVILSARAGVMQDIAVSGMYGGFPLESHKESLRTLMSVPEIKNLRKQVNKILSHLKLKEEN